jgi:hypothetical protein
VQPTSFPGSQTMTCRQRTVHKSTEPLTGRLGVASGRTARAPCISRVGEIEVCRGVGRMGSISDDGPGQHNPDRSEDPWGKAAMAA